MQEEEIVLVTDDAYSGKEGHDLDEGKKIYLVHTDFFGKSVDDILAGFVFNEMGRKVLRCFAGYEPNPMCADIQEANPSRLTNVQVAFNKDQCKAKKH